MARNKVFISKPFFFKTRFKVRITDINYGNHLSNDKILSLVHECRVQFLQSLEYSELNIEGFGIIMADAVIEFKNQAYYADELEIALTIDNLYKKGFEMFYQVYNKTKNNITARIKTGIVFFNYEEQAIGYIPEAFIRKIDTIESINGGNNES